ncbi:MAG: ABC transporter permease, partial [Bacteroidota bacterium]
MDNFDLNAAVARWRTDMISAGNTDPALLEELESSLHDRYEGNLLRGHTAAVAFSLAVEKVAPSTSGLISTGSLSPEKNVFVSLLPNYLKVALRSLKARGSFNLINFSCLTIAIITTAIAAFYLNYETSFDVQVPEVAHKYRVGMQLRSQQYSMLSFDDFFDSSAAGQLEMVNGLENIRGVKSAAQFQTFPEPNRATSNQRTLVVEDILQTNTPRRLCRYFGWDFLLGSAVDFAAATNSAILTRPQAERYFGEKWLQADIIGANLRIDTTDYAIVGVVEAPPSNSHFTYSIALHQAKIDYWGPRIYLEAEAGEDITNLKQRIDNNFNTINIRLAEDELFGGVVLQPLRSIHLNSDLLYELKPPGNKAYLLIIGIIALIILLLTVSNYTNLSIAMNAGRAREIGMRRVFGATDRQIAGQFLLEALVLSGLT